MIVLLGFAFLSGLVTILAPCIWPLLPIVLSSSITGKGHQRPLGITLGIMLSFTIFTLSISYLVKFFHIDPYIFRIIAVVVIAFLGFTMIIPALTKILELAVSRLSGAWGTRGQTQGGGFGGGFITGLSLGVVWSPCAGPILAAIAALAATGQVTSTVVLVTIAYVIGVGIPLFAFAYGGQKIAVKSRLLTKYTGRIQQVFGIIMILTALAIYTNYDKTIQAKLLDIFPQLSQTVRFEGNDAVKKQLDLLKGVKGTSTTGIDQKNLGPAPEFIGITHWLNTDEKLKLSHLKGKVVLVDFWTYTCINCIRTLPHVTQWYEKYKDKGFIVIGVHTPEFEFEKDIKNVENAIRQYNIAYPVALDNNYATWTNYNNRYWPAEYLIDANGKIRLTHFGEGKYEETEKAIAALLKEAGQQIIDNVQGAKDETPTGDISKETYLGSGRSKYFQSGTLTNGAAQFNLADNLASNNFSLGGTWTVNDEEIVAGEHAVLEINVKARKVFLVLRPPNPPAGGGLGIVKVLVDGKGVRQDIAGTDVKDSSIIIDTDRLYTLLDFKEKIKEHKVRLEFQTPGTKAFAFTFG